MIELVTLMIIIKLQIENTIKMTIWNANVLLHRILELNTFVHDKGNDVMLITETLFC